MSYLWLLYELSMALAYAIYGSYMCYLWHLHELSMAVTEATWQHGKQFL